MRLNDKLAEENTRFCHTRSGEEEITKYNAIMNSNISILRLWISIFSRETVIIPRAYNVYYSECGFHSAIGTPVCILTIEENDIKRRINEFKRKS